MNDLKLVPPRLSAHVVANLIGVVGMILQVYQFKGFWRVTRALGRLAPPDQACSVQVGEAGRFAFQLADPYWARLVYPGFQYESELIQILEELKGLRFDFVDCGANLGYWSVLASDPAINCASVCAVEASPQTFELLRRNWELNGKRFEILNKAIFSESALTVHIKRDPVNHAGASLCSAGADSDAVTTISIDDLIQKKNSGRPTLVKLDVEGVEIDAFKGASRAIQGDTLFAYEDHGRDSDCAVTAWLLRNTPLKIYFIDGAGKKYSIEAPSDAARLKHDRSKGYNFFATRLGSTFSKVFEPGSLDA